MDQVLPFIPSFLFGLALQRGRVHESAIVMGQMTFSHFVMLKMFLTALGSSCLVSAYYFKTKCTDEEKRETYYQRQARGLRAVVIGAALVGIGMTLTGSCPGTVYAQLGALSWMAIPIMLGCLGGAVVFEQFIQPQLTSIGFFQQDMLPKEKNALYKIVNAQFQLNLLPEQFLTYMGGGLLGFSLLLELLVNWKGDLSTIYPETWQDLTFATAQPAMISGLMIGAAQYVSLFHFDKQLGCSYTFVEFLQMGFKAAKPQLQQLNDPKCNEICNNTCESISNPQTPPNPITAYGIMAGAFVGMVLSGMYVGRSATDFPQINIFFLIIRLLLGGFISIIGARVAGGCTSGIGLSYTSVGSTTGAVGMCSMFGAAIFTGIIFKIIF